MEGLIASLIILISTSSLVSSTGMECIRNKDCAHKHEHICNMQSGLWTKNYILVSKNNSFVDSLDSCSCCFPPEVFKTKVSQRGLFDSIMTLETEANIFVNRVKPCSPLKKFCSKTSDCCTGYCSISERGGVCHDPVVLKDDSTIVFPFSAATMIRNSGGPQHVTARPTPDMNFLATGIVATTVDKNGSLTLKSNNSLFTSN